MKVAGIFFFFAFVMSGGVLTSSVYDLSFMNYTICHEESKIIDSKKSEIDMEYSDYDFKSHKHLEVHVIEIIPHLFHGDKLVCNKKHKH